MKIGISINIFDNGYGRFGDEIYNKIKEHGFDAVDFSMADSNSLLYTMDPAIVERTILHHKALAQEAGIEFSQVHGTWRYPPRDESEKDREERMEKMEKSIHLTNLLGCKYWVVHPLIPYGIDDLEKRNFKRTYAINYDFFKKLLPIAHENDVTICLENMPWQKFSLSKPENIVKLIKDIKDDNFKMCLDTGHLNIFSDLNIEKELKRCEKYLKVIHVHDSIGKIDAHLMPFEGRFDFMTFAHCLKKIDFDGVFSFETSPSSKLPTQIFESMSKSLCDIGRYLVG